MLDSPCLLGDVLRPSPEGAMGKSGRLRMTKGAAGVRWIDDSYLIIVT